MRGDTSYNIHVALVGLDEIKDKVDQINKLITEVEELAGSIKQSKVYLMLDPKENDHDIDQGNG